MRVVIGLTHRPCGACGELVDLVEGCEHLRVKRVRQRPARLTAAMADRAGLLAALGYPRA